MSLGAGMGAKWKQFSQWFLANIWMGNGKNWKFVSLVVVLFFALLTPLLFLVKVEEASFIQKLRLTSVFQVFEVSGGNFDLGIKKIPFNAPSIDLTLSQPIDVDSLSGGLFSMTPEIPGVLKLKDEYTLSYELSEKMEIGKEYMILLSGKLLSKKKKELGTDQMFVLTAVPGAKVDLIMPKGLLGNLSQNIAVFFSVPMVSLEDLDSSETIPCPLTLSPSVEGDCHWTTPSLLEFMPKKAWNGATAYSIQVADTPGLNFPLEAVGSGQFQTPNLSLSVDQSFSPRHGIHLHFNYPVEGVEVLKRLSLTQGSSTGKTLSGVLTPVDQSETDFILTSNPPLLYSQAYQLTLKEGLMPKYGNIPMLGAKSFTLRSINFVTSIVSNRNVYSSTGVLVDTMRYGGLTPEEDPQEFSPKNAFFDVSFDEEMPLKKEFFRITSDGGTPVAFNLKYGQTYDAKNQPIDNKQNILIEISDTLTPNTGYSLSFLASSNKAMTKDLVFKLKTPKPLEVLDYKLVDYSLSCLTLNHPLSLRDQEYYKIDTEIGFLHATGALRYVTQEPEVPWAFYKTIQDLPIEQRNKKLVEKGYCPESNGGEFVYTLDHRLAPNAQFTFQLSNITDQFGQKLQKSFTKQVQTGPLRPTDEYAYIGLENYTNIYPDHVPLLVNLQSVNTSKFSVSVCELDSAGYRDYDLHSYEEGFSPRCVATVKKELPAKLAYWKVTNQRFDVETEILGRKLATSHALLTVAPLGNTLNTESRMIVKTNLSLALEKAKNYSLLYATDLPTQQEVLDLSLSFYDFNGQKVVIPYTIDKKLQAYQIQGNLEAIHTIEARSDKHFALIRQDDEFSNYDFKYVSGMESTFKDYAFIYGDRPIYRPGDEVFFKGLVREFHPNGYKKSSVTGATLTMIDENYETYKEIEVKLDKNSNFSGSFTLPADSKLGTFRFELTAENRYFATSGDFSIEQYKKPTFKVNISPTKDDFTVGESLDLTIEPTYYFGGKLSNTTGVSSMVGQKYYFDAKDYQDYQFGDGDAYFECVYWGYCQYDDTLSEVSDFRINGEGKYDFSTNFGTGSSERIYTLSFDVTDPDTKKVVSNSVSKVVHATDGYVGVKGNYYQSKKEGLKFDLIWLDFEAKELPFKQANIEVYRLEQKDVKEQGVDGYFYHNYNREEKLEKSFTLIGEKDGKLSYTYTPSTTGMYKLKISYTGLNKQSFSTIKEVYVAGDEYISWGNDNNSVTELSAEKTTYKLGETASFTLKSPVNTGKLFVVLEKDDGILEAFTKPITSYGERIEIPIKEAYAPNVYVKVFLIGSQPNNPLPVYKRALGLIKIVPDFKKLTVKITPDKQRYQPADKMSVTISVVDAYGKPVSGANGSLSVVDESVLALKGNPKKNPYSFFYDMKRYLGVSTFSNLKYLVEKLEVKDASDGEKGGAGSQVKGGDTKKLRGNFKDTAFWQSDFTTDSQGRAILTIPKLPDNLTTWVLESIVSTDDNKIGITYESVQTSLELMVSENLPRFVQYGDKITLTPQIFNHSTKDQTLKVTLRAQHALPATLQKTIQVKAGESVSVAFPLQIDPDTGSPKRETLDVDLEAVAVGSALSDGVSLHLPITNSSTPETVTTVGKTKDVAVDETINLSNINKYSASLQINYGATLFSYLTDGLDFVGSFPYGCAEQRTSAIMPYVYRKALMNELSRDYDLKKIFIQKYISKEVGYQDVSLDQVITDYLTVIKNFQHTDGGFLYWDDLERKQSDLHLTQYMIPSLVALKEIGYKVDEKMIESGRTYLKAKFKDLPLCTDKVQTKCLSVDEKIVIIKALLAVNQNDYESYKMYLVIKDSLSHSTFSHAELLASLVAIPSLSEGERTVLSQRLKKEVDLILSSGLVQNARGAFLMGYGSNRATINARFLAFVSKAGMEQFKDYETITDSMIRFVIASKEHNSFGSTYETQEIIKSLTNFLKSDTSLTKTNMDTLISFNTTQLARQSITPTNVFDSFHISKELYQAPNLSKISLKKTGEGTLYYDLSLSYTLPSKTVKPRDYGFAVVKTYYNYDEYARIYKEKKDEYLQYQEGKIRYEELKYTKDVGEYLTPITTGKIGDLVLVSNKVITSENRDQVSFESFIPSGSEIINTKLSSETKSVDNIGSNITPDREEMRDDRYFAYFDTFSPGIYTLAYTIRLTHAGTFGIKPTVMQEFYNPEIFGRSEGMEWITKE